MLVFALESLAQTFDGYNPTWDDYDQSVKSKLDKELTKVDGDIAERIRSTLLLSSHLKLRKRFVDFISFYVEESYFLEEAFSRKFPLRKSELARAISNVYDMRSKYVHKLDEIQLHLKVDFLAEFDVFRWGNEPYLTYSGLVRLCRHVINNFVLVEDRVAKEDVDWQRDIPGIITMKLAPEYWALQYDPFTPQDSLLKFIGFIEFINQKHQLLDIEKLLLLYEQNISQAKKEHQIPMMCLYYLYNSLIVQDKRLPKFQEILDKYGVLLNTAKVETILCRLLTTGEIIWSGEECAKVYEDYNLSRFQAKSVEIPQKFEVLIIMLIANLFLHKGNIDMYKHWSYRGVFEAAGRRKLQEQIVEDLLKQTELDMKAIHFDDRSDETQTSQ